MSTANARNYSEGQVWFYKTRPVDEGSTLLINKVESDPRLGMIYHISVLGVLVKNRHAPGGVTQELPHFPVGRETLDASCTGVLRHSEPNPDYREGYAEWKRAFDQGKAGVFSIPVSEIVDVVESSIGK